MKDIKFWNKDRHSLQTNCKATKLCIGWCIWQTQFFFFFETGLYFTFRKRLLEPSSCHLTSPLLNRNSFIMENIWLWRCHVQVALSPSKFSFEGLELREMGPSQLSSKLRLHDWGLRKPFLSMVMGVQQESLCRKRKEWCRLH